MLRLANASDLFHGRKVIPCHNLSTAEYCIKHEDMLDDEDWVEWEDGSHCFLKLEVSEQVVTNLLLNNGYIHHHWSRDLP